MALFNKENIEKEQEEHRLEEGFFNAAFEVYAKTIGCDLVPIVPMDNPINIRLPFIDVDTEVTNE